MALSDYEKGSGSMVLCGQSACKGKESCARWKYRNRKSGGYVLVIHRGKQAAQCEDFVGLGEVSLDPHCSRVSKSHRAGGNSKQRRTARRAAKRGA